MHEHAIAELEFRVRELSQALKSAVLHGPADCVKPHRRRIASLKKSVAALRRMHTETNSEERGA
jgi:hypothetical protein